MTCVNNWGSWVSAPRNVPFRLFAIQVGNRRGDLRSDDSARSGDPRRTSLETRVKRDLRRAARRPYDRRRRNGPQVELLASIRTNRPIARRCAAVATRQRCGNWTTFQLRPRFADAGHGFCCLSRQTRQQFRIRIPLGQFGRGSCCFGKPKPASPDYSRLGEIS